MLDTKRTMAALGALVALALPVSAASAREEHVLAADGGVKYNLADLADGETRTFGTGERTVTARRSGDEVEVTFPAKDGERRTMRCQIGKDSCFVMTHDGNGRTMVMLSKDGDEESTNDVFVTSGDAVVASAAGRDIHWIHDGPGDPDSVFLRCPKGDTTMRLKKDEADASYTCPKHGVKLEKSKAPHVIKKVIVETRGGDKEP